MQSARTRHRARAGAAEAAGATGASETTGPGDARAPTETRIVGIGASAGGLEALDQLLRNAPSPSGLAFVVVQHLDPSREALLVELLQRATTMPVQEIVEGTALLADHVYVMPPNRDVRLVDGLLRLAEPIQPRGHRLPIDAFLRSLAADRGPASIGVVLSGMGSDGTLGLRAIREAAGSTFAQSPATAKFDPMPQSAIEAGVVDVIAPAAELAAKIVEHSRRRAFSPGVAHSATATATTDDSEAVDAAGLEKILRVLHEQVGHDFAAHKRTSMVRRIERRMLLRRIGTIGDYARLLEGDPEEGAQLFSELLIGVTSFFRDPDVWEQLKTAVLAPLVAGRRSGATLRAWVPACSTGEEAYTLAIVLSEAIEEAGLRGLDVQIFGTDLDPRAIERARGGTYPLGIAADVTEARIGRHFVLEEKCYRVTRTLRDKVVFAPHDLLGDPPFSRLDVLSCRNLLIYLEPPAQQQLMRLFHHCLAPGGTLVLGSAETVGASNDLFAPLTGKTRIYRSLALPPRARGAPIPDLAAVFGRPKTPAVAPTKVRPRAGRPGATAETEDAPPRQGAPGASPTRARSGAPSSLAQRLAVAEHEMEVAREEAQTSMEELGSTNEELQSANEELQSTIEELTTSKEEMQSMNEELQTVNQELVAKLDELSRASADMKNLLDSTDIATLFLDQELRVRRFTPQMSKIIKLIPGDVGRPITDLAIDLRGLDLAADGREVLRTLVVLEREVEGSGDRWFRVRTMPYRNQDNRIDGLVVTLTDIGAAKTLEAERRRARSLVERASPPKPSGGGT